MKSILILFCCFFTLTTLSGQTCPPDSNGNYIYYINLNVEGVNKDFNKEAFIKLLSKSPHFNDKINIELNKKIGKVEKAFPSSKTLILQKSIRVVSKDSSLSLSLNLFKDEVKLVEKTCSPKSLYQPNDFQYNGNPLSHLELINADKAYDITTGDHRILIGITDTYIESTHEDLQNKIEQILYNVPWGPIQHGTAVAGCAAAETDNGKGVASTGNKSKIVFSSNASDNENLIISQIPGVRVINLSWYDPSCSFNSQQNLLYSEIVNMNNVVVVAAAGNHCGDCGCNAYLYPASYDDVISVTSVGHISNIGYVDPIYGANNWKDCHDEVINTQQSHHHNDKVDICAPGYNIMTTRYNNSTTNDYFPEWGTSFSSPMVAGVCALVAAVNPCLSAQQIRDIVLNTADPNIYMLDCNVNYIGLLGRGRVDAYEAVKRAIETGTFYVQNKTYSSGAITESAQTDIVVGYNVTNQQPFGLVTINQNANVVFEATHSIILGEGFQVLNNAQFEAKIVDSSCF